MSEAVSVHLTIRGRVQGVGYRAFVEDVAMRHRLNGWVRNRRDGTVEAVLSGSAAAVNAAIDRCQTGPRFARVDAVEQREPTAEELTVGASFRVLPTL